MSPNRARLLVGVAAALVLVLLVVGFMAGEREQHRLDRDRQAESTLEASLRVTRASTASQRRNIKAAAVFGKALAHDLVDAHADVTLTQAVLTNAKHALQQAQNALGSQSARRATVEQCLTGVRRALDATRTRNTAAATSFLRAAAPACQSALAPGARAPALAYDFADPFLMRAGSTYYAFATNAAGGSVQEARGSDLNHLELTGNALGNIPSWGLAGSVWAPAALQRSDATLLYYTVREASSSQQCLSVAIGAGPGGPFLDGSTAPLECGTSGAIDPSPFFDASGNAFLLYKTESPPRIWSRPLTADGRAFAGPGTQLLAPSQRWESGNVEAPSMLRNGSTYWLFYSGNNWNGKSYAEGVARCAGPAGPCTAESANPILASQGGVDGPGGGEVFTDTSGHWWLAYHAYREPLVGYPNSRLLYFAPIGFTASGRPAINP
jgi:Glycosyl hydrolases family 43